MDTKQLTELYLLALAIYREARGASQAARVAVGCVIRNRVQHPAWYGKDWFTVITHPFQFSSFNKGDPNSATFGSPIDPVWQACVEAATSVYGGSAVDQTNGALFYYSTPIQHLPDWVSQYKRVADIGPFHFYKP